MLSHIESMLVEEKLSSLGRIRLERARWSMAQLANYDGAWRWFGQVGLRSQKVKESQWLSFQSDSFALILGITMELQSIEREGKAFIISSWGTKMRSTITWRRPQYIRRSWSQARRFFPWSKARLQLHPRRSPSGRRASSRKSRDSSEASPIKVFCDLIVMFI